MIFVHRNATNETMWTSPSQGLKLIAFSTIDIEINVTKKRYYVDAAALLIFLFTFIEINRKSFTHNIGKLNVGK